jgi:hypothetical protein
MSPDIAMTRRSEIRVNGKITVLGEETLESFARKLDPGSRPGRTRG